MISLCVCLSLYGCMYVFVCQLEDRDVYKLTQVLIACTKQAKDASIMPICSAWSKFATFITPSCKDKENGLFQTWFMIYPSKTLQDVTIHHIIQGIQCVSKDKGSVSNMVYDLSKQNTTKHVTIHHIIQSIQCACTGNAIKDSSTPEGTSNIWCQIYIFIDQSALDGGCDEYHTSHFCFQKYFWCQFQVVLICEYRSIKKNLCPNVNSTHNYRAGRQTPWVADAPYTL